MILYDFVTSSSESNVLTSLSLDRKVNVGILRIFLPVGLDRRHGQSYTARMGDPGECCVQLPDFGG